LRRAGSSSNANTTLATSHRIEVGARHGGRDERTEIRSSSVREFCRNPD
jgi:hypothetical protein